MIFKANQAKIEFESNAIDLDYVLLKFAYKNIIKLKRCSLRPKKLAY